MDHRVRKVSKLSSLVQFIYPDREEELKAGHKTAGRYGADFGELRALERSVQTEAGGYAGIFHYRRTLDLAQISPNPVSNSSENWEGKYINYWNWTICRARGWSKRKLKNLAKKNLVILPLPLDMRDLRHESVFDQFIESHGNEILDALEESWGGTADFIAWMKSSRFTIPYNITIAPFEERMALFSWLTKIITPLEESLKGLSTDHYQKRWPGFLSERLSGYYWLELKKDKIKYFAPVLRLDRANVLDKDVNVRLEKFLSSQEPRIGTLELELGLIREFEKDTVTSLQAELQETQFALAEVLASHSWLLTEPFRRAIAKAGSLVRFARSR